MKSNKAQGFSTHTIIVFTIGAIILVVIIAMLTSKAGFFGRGASGCTGRGEYAKCLDSCAGGDLALTGIEECKEQGKKYCCVEIEVEPIEEEHIVVE